jgi:ADP-heptose:LPS heptosyltransferase
LPLSNTKKIFVLRNNDLGDVLVCTPLLYALKKAFPFCSLAIGVGDWAKSLLEHNPSIDEILPCNAPWHNKQICRFPANSSITFLQGLLYCLFNKETKYIAKKRFNHGIDVLGSRQGSWLMFRSGIKNRFGVHGYAGGDSLCHRSIQFNENRHVSHSCLEFLKLLKINLEIEARPMIYLTKKETEQAVHRWGIDEIPKLKIVLAPGGGFQEKCWGDENYTQLSRSLLHDANNRISIIGSDEDKSRIKSESNKNLKNFCGKLSLRESAALVSEADFVITNSSVSMHLAGAFKIPSITLLGDWYDSANLHKQQWGYPESIVLGKETKEGITNIASVDETMQRALNLFKTRSS